jgi:hypothetical protein
MNPSKTTKFLILFTWACHQTVTGCRQAIRRQENASPKHQRRPAQQSTESPREHKTSIILPNKHLQIRTTSPYRQQQKRGPLCACVS